jgi:G3E family GTPase
VARDEEDQRTVSDLLVSQIEFADVILINKVRRWIRTQLYRPRPALHLSPGSDDSIGWQVDLVSSDEAAYLSSVLRELNPSARVLPTRQSSVPLREVLNTSAFDMDKVARLLKGGLRSQTDLMEIITLYVPCCLGGRGTRVASDSERRAGQESQARPPRALASSEARL